MRQTSSKHYCFLFLQLLLHLDLRRNVKSLNVSYRILRVCLLEQFGASTEMYRGIVIFVDSWRRCREVITTAECTVLIKLPVLLPALKQRAYQHYLRYFSDGDQMKWGSSLSVSCLFVSKSHSCVKDMMLYAHACIESLFVNIILKNSKNTFLDFVLFLNLRRSFCTEFSSTIRFFLVCFHFRKNLTILAPVFTLKRLQFF